MFLSRNLDLLQHSSIRDALFRRLTLVLLFACMLTQVSVLNAQPVPLEIPIEGLVGWCPTANGLSAHLSFRGNIVIAGTSNRWLSVQ